MINQRDGDIKKRNIYVNALILVFLVSIFIITIIVPIINIDRKEEIAYDFNSILIAEKQIIHIDMYYVEDSVSDVINLYYDVDIVSKIDQQYCNMVMSISYEYKDEIRENRFSKPYVYNLCHSQFVNREKVISDKFGIQLAADYLQYYPFDSTKSEFTIAIGWSENDTMSVLKQDLIASEVHWNINFPGRKIEQKYSNDNKGFYQIYTLSAAIERMSLYKYLLITIVLGVVIIILLMSVFDDISVLFQLYLGVIFSLFSLKQIIVPFNSKSPTLADYSFIYVYLFILLSLIFRVGLISYQIWRKYQDKILLQKLLHDQPK